MMDDLPLAFAVHRRREPPPLEVRVNFGLLTGRTATPAEIDRLATWLLDEVGAVSIVAEDRHEIDGHGEAAVQQVRIEVPGRAPAELTDRRALEERLVARASHWARLCAADRQGAAELEPY
jgi:hypothetical protein